MRLLLAESIIGRRSLGFSAVLFIIAGFILYSGTVGAFLPGEQAIVQIIEQTNPDVVFTLQIQSNWSYDAQKNLTDSIESLSSISNADTIFLKDGFDIDSETTSARKILGVSTHDIPEWMENETSYSFPLGENETLVDASYEGILEIGSNLRALIPHSSSQNEQSPSINLTIVGYYSFQNILYDSQTNQLFPLAYILNVHSSALILVDFESTLLRFILKDDPTQVSYISVDINNDELVPFDVGYLNDKIHTIESNILQMLPDTFQLNGVDSILSSRLSLIAGSVQYMVYWALTTWFLFSFTTYVVVSYASRSVIISNRIVISRLVKMGIRRTHLMTSLKTTICGLAILGGFTGSILAKYALGVYSTSYQSNSPTGIITPMDIIVIIASTLILLPIVYSALGSNITSIIDTDNTSHINSAHNFMSFTSSRAIKSIVFFMVCYIFLSLIIGTTPFETLKGTYGLSLPLYLLLSILAAIEIVIAFAGEIIVSLCLSLILIYGIRKIAGCINVISRRFGLFYHSGTQTLSETLKIDPSPIVILLILTAVVVTSSSQLLSINDLASRNAAYYTGADAAVYVKPNGNTDEIVDYLMSRVESENLTVEYYTPGYVGNLMQNIRFIDRDTWLDVAYYESEWFSTDPQSILNELEENQILISNWAAEALQIEVGDVIMVSQTIGNPYNISLEVIGLLHFSSSRVSERGFSVVSQATLEVLNCSFSLGTRILLALDEQIDKDFLYELEFHDDILRIMTAEIVMLPFEDRVLIEGRLYIAEFLLRFTLSISIAIFLLISWFLVAERTREISVIRKRGISKRKSLVYLSSGMLLWLIVTVTLGTLTALVGFAGTLVFRNALLSGIIHERIVFSPSLYLIICGLVAACVVGVLVSSYLIIRKEVNSH
ncbi:MAG: ABC transporter permease [Candidatus Thorarchaeota archaeon]|nr:MAG: ABC transporter permease [Candidatus Thorarchaeota archaeon]